MIKKYKIGFDIWGLIIFIIIMIPNFIWFAVPAPNDILRGESITVLAPGGNSHSGPGGNRQLWPDENSQS